MLFENAPEFRSHTPDSSLGVINLYAPMEAFGDPCGIGEATFKANPALAEKIEGGDGKGFRGA
jgi:hypothetical protein